MTRELLAYYERGGEHDRLRRGRGRLEFWRTQDVLRRVLPEAPARVLDVGGGTGVHAEWLAADGYLNAGQCSCLQAGGEGPREGHRTRA
ncbi:hypothetical protein [Streptosporangium sp. NPDC051022]|uniref:hypothetical protein n=1 Tax=Streptosporangium sp. NPDC051022 TaxID=3155752 RepID=UPI0034140C18